VRDQVVSDRPAHKGAFNNRTRYLPPSDKLPEMTMRKPKDFDAQLKALAEKAKALKDNKLHRLGELVVATGADAIDMETLAGGLLAMTAATDSTQRAAWKKAGGEMFRKGLRPAKAGTSANRQGAQAGNSGCAPS
jgi:hypothetical protein